jgi:cytidyltransferase-like protein
MKATPLYPSNPETLCLNHKTKVLVNGAFDILHTGHIDLFMYAKSLGYVICAIDSDERIRQNKGIDRPVNPLAVRAKILSRIIDINEVWSFNSDVELISLMSRADVRVIGSDWKGKDIVGEDLIDIDFFERVNDEATTNTLEDYINRRNLLGRV